MGGAFRLLSRAASSTTTASAWRNARRRTTRISSFNFFYTHVLAIFDFLEVYFTGGQPLQADSARLVASSILAVVVEVYSLTRPGTLSYCDGIRSIITKIAHIIITHNTHHTSSHIYRRRLALPYSSTRTIIKMGAIAPKRLVQNRQGGGSEYLY